MAKDKLTDYDATASNNTDVGGVSVAEGMLPSSVNNAIREQMSHLADFASGTSGVDVLKLQDDTDTNSIKLQAPASVTATTTFTLPDGDGTADQVLKTDGSGQLGFADRHANPSLIINGAMQVAQRGTSWTGIGNGDTDYYIDRWRHQESGTPTYEFTLSQDTDAPAGFGYSFKWQCTTAQSSLSSNNRIRTEYYIEGQDLQRLAKGTASAQEMTLSFWIKSNVTGTYVANFEDANTRQVSKTFTIDNSATWEYKSLTFPADTSGSLANDNTKQLTLRIFFGAGTDYTSGTLQTSWGSVVNANQAAGITANVASSTSNYIQFTGVKLEVGDTATPFVHRSYGEELALCQRYYQIIAGGVGIGASSTSIETSFTRKEMRAAPSGATTGTVRFEDPTVGNKTQSSGAVLITVASARSEKCQFTNFSGLTSARPYFMKSDSGLLALDAEL